MPFVPERVGFPCTKNPPWAGPSVAPDYHALVKTIDPAGAKILLHVLIPTRNHLPNLPKFISIWWRVAVLQAQVASNFFEAFSCKI